MATYEELTIDQGADVTIELQCVDITGAQKDLADHQVAAKMKKNYNSDSADTITFITGISADPAHGIITLSLDNNQTDTLKAGRYVYDVELSFIDSSGDTIIERILEGRIQVTPSVTK
jgi:hypothetical protein